MNFFYKLFFITLTVTHFMNAQNKGVGIGIREVNPSAILHLESEDKALLLPNISSDQRIKNPEAGMVIFDQEKECLSFYNGDKWSCASTDCGATNPNKGIGATKDKPIAASEGCSGILHKDPSTLGKHGTYYFTDEAQTTFASYCYMGYGGWTLVWSFSADHNYDNYDPVKKLNMNPQKYAFVVDNPMGNSNGPEIPFENFRLSKARMQQIANKKEYYVQLTRNPKEMYKNDDAFELNNYLVMTGEKHDIFTNTSYLNKELTIEGRISGNDIDPAEAKSKGYALMSATEGGFLYNPEPPHISIDDRRYTGKGSNAFGYVSTDEFYKNGNLVNCDPKKVDKDNECRLSETLPFDDNKMPYIMWFMR